MTKHNVPVTEKPVLGVHRGIFMRGLVSFLTDLSSEKIFSVISIFLTVILGGHSRRRQTQGWPQHQRRHYALPAQSHVLPGVPP